MYPRLAGVDAKLRRAQELLDLEDGEWGAWIAREEPWSTERELLEVVLNAFTFPIEPIAREALIKPDSALIDGTKLASFHFERPLSPDVQVKTRLPVQVALGDDRNARAGHLRETVEVVRGLTGAAEALSTSYRPRFAAPRQRSTVRA